MGELEDTRRDILGGFMDQANLIVEQLIKTMFLDYQLLSIVTLVSTFGLLPVVFLKDIKLLLIVLVLYIEDSLLLLLLAITITVNLVHQVVPLAPHIIFMIYYGMEQDVCQAHVVMTLPSLGSIVN